jgi:hypothetical protein
VTAVLCNDGATQFGKLCQGIVAYSEMDVRLFTNNHTPVPDDVVTNFSECTLAGYARAVLTPGSWSGFATAGGVFSDSYPTIIFTFSAYSGGVIIYGYFVTDTGSIPTKVYWAESLSVPYTVPSGGGGFPLSITWNDKLC